MGSDGENRKHVVRNWKCSSTTPTATRDVSNPLSLLSKISLKANPFLIRLLQPGEELVNMDDPDVLEIVADFEATAERRQIVVQRVTKDDAAPQPAS